MTGLLDKLCSAICSMEGWWTPGSRPRRNHNPGDLRGAPWLNHPQMDGGYWLASSDAEGIAGLYHQVALDIARGMTAKQLVYAWAPPSDGNLTARYLTYVCGAVGVEPDRPLNSYLELVRPS